MFLSLKVKLSLDFSHRFLNCDDFFKCVEVGGSRERVDNVL